MKISFTQKCFPTSLKVCSSRDFEDERNGIFELHRKG